MMIARRSSSLTLSPQPQKSLCSFLKPNTNNNNSTTITIFKRRNLTTSNINVSSSFLLSQNSRNAIHLPKHPHSFKYSCCLMLQQENITEGVRPFSSSSSSSSNKIKSLRKLTKPFLLLVHPDRTTTHSLSSTSQSTNLKALQTLNGLLDIVEHLYNRAFTSSKSSSSYSGRMELKEVYSIEFVVTRINHGSSNKKKKKRGEDEEMISTTKSVEITFPNRIRNGIQMVDSRTGAFSKKYAEALKNWTTQELCKLLRVAGLALPSSLSDLDKNEEEEKGEREDDEFDIQNLLREELDIDLDDDNMGNTTNQRFADMRHPRDRKKTQRELSREKFMKTIDWKAFRLAYDKVYEDAQADWLTKGYISKNPQRKREFVSNVISRVRILDTTTSSAVDATAAVKENTTKHSNIAKKEDTLEEEENRKEELGLDSVHQLIAIRRLSLILYDYFDELEMEQMGRLWEQTTLVLTPERQLLKEIEEEGSLEKSAIGRKKKKKLSKESGFKFALQSNDDVTIYVPIDFQDDEFVEELSVYMWDLYNLRMGQKNGYQLNLEDLMPMLKNVK
mmetsp:Transcript_23825/g.35576  ORF Transcript_23825/g.35576 Transcript_23825/m.35576 type:complete len:561 (-) Transcript_23825:344-2026(-)